MKDANIHLECAIFAQGMYIENNLKMSKGVMRICRRTDNANAKKGQDKQSLTKHNTKEID